MTGLSSSFVPAWRASRGTATAVPGVANRAAGQTRGQRRLRAAFVAAQVGLSLVLLAGAGLMVNSVVRMTRADAGSAVDSLVYADVALPREKYPTKAAQDLLFDQLLKGVRGFPSIHATAIGTPTPAAFHGRFVPEGREVAAEGNPVLSIYSVDDEYFEVAEVPIVEGRGFGPGDRTSVPVAVIDEDAARRFWPGDRRASWPG